MTTLAHACRRSLYWPVLVPALLIVAGCATTNPMSIWLGGDPPNPEMKAGLLGGACG